MRLSTRKWMRSRLNWASRSDAGKGFGASVRLGGGVERKATAMVYTAMALPNASPETLLSAARSRSSHEQRKLIQEAVARSTSFLGDSFWMLTFPLK